LAIDPYLSRVSGVHFLRPPAVRAESFDIITPGTEHIKCHAGLDPASRSTPDNAFVEVKNIEDKNN
jgi:hypothetical protein